MITLQECLDSLRQSGQKLTPQRTEVLRVLIHSRNSLTARDVHLRVKKTFPHVSLDTVYRNLLMLTESGYVSQINLQNKAISRFEFQGDDHHHHAVCLTCGATFCIDSCFIPKKIPPPREDKDFRIVSHAVEIYGECSKCAQARSL
ncbi:MAG: transcriptional repressor [Spirochaetia bacterium]|nr:transcriptional repressor [Spirochaetia bacterium]